MLNKILSLIKEKGLNVSTVEKQLGFGNGSIKRFKTNSPSVDKIVKLSNFLNVSVDYLLGLSDNPNIQTTSNNILNSTVTGSSVIQSNNSSNIVVGNNNYKSNNETKKKELSKQALELAEIFDNLGIREQNEILSTIFEIEDRNKKR